MKKTNLVVWVLVVVFSVVFYTSTASAKESKKDKDCKYSLEKKVLRKCRLALVYQDDLGLSDEQIKKISDLKIKSKKDLIRKKSEIDLLSVDIKSELREDEIDTKTVGKLIDKKYEIKKEKAKSLVNAYANLKNILTAEQKIKFKNIVRKSRK